MGGEGHHLTLLLGGIVYVIAYFAINAFFKEKAQLKPDVDY